MQPKMGENVVSTPWINTPKEAKNISFFGAGLFWPSTAYEFDIEEEAFLKWTQRSGHKLEKIKDDEPFYIHTYKSLQTANYSEAKKHMKKITLGYKYEYRQEDRGRYVGYDKSSNRAYVFYHTR